MVPQDEITIDFIHHDTDGAELNLISPHSNDPTDCNECRRTKWTSPHPIAFERQEAELDPLLRDKISIQMLFVIFCLPVIGIMAATAKGNIFDYYLLWGISSWVSVAVVTAALQLQKVTQIRIDRGGICLEWRKRKKIVRSKHIAGASFLRAIELKRPAFGKPRIEFVSRIWSEISRYSIPLSTFSTQQQWREFVAALEKFPWSAVVEIDPAIEAALPCDPSDARYTQIWLAALSSPPQRDRLKPLADGTRLSRYEVVRQLGAGGQGVAYLARDLEKVDGPPLVLKEYLLPVFVDVRAGEPLWKTSSRKRKRFHHWIIKA